MRQTGLWQAELPQDVIEVFPIFPHICIYIYQNISAYMYIYILKKYEKIHHNIIYVYMYIHPTFLFGGQVSESYAIVLGRICRCWRISRRIPQARNHLRPLAHAPTSVPTEAWNWDMRSHIYFLHSIARGSIDFLWKFLGYRLASLHLKVVTYYHSNCISFHFLRFWRSHCRWWGCYAVLKSP